MATPQMLPPPSSEALKVATSIAFPKAEPVRGTWAAIVETARETARPPARANASK